MFAAVIWDCREIQGNRAHFVELTMERKYHLFCRATRASKILSFASVSCWSDLIGIWHNRRFLGELEAPWFQGTSYFFLIWTNHLVNASILILHGIFKGSAKKKKNAVKKKKSRNLFINTVGPLIPVTCSTVNGIIMAGWSIDMVSSFRILAKGIACQCVNFQPKISHYNGNRNVQSLIEANEIECNIHTAFSSACSRI